MSVCHERNDLCTMHITEPKKKTFYACKQKRKLKLFYSCLTIQWYPDKTPADFKNMQLFFGTIECLQGINLPTRLATSTVAISCLADAILLRL